MGLGRFEIWMFWSEFVCILFYGLFVEFGEGVRASTVKENEALTISHMANHYPMYMDIHVMIFVGFGFLMSFLKNNSWTALGFTYLIACWAL
jgi:ammonium transporter Rh